MNKRKKVIIENSIKRLIKSLGYPKLRSFETGLIDCQFVENGITIIIKAKK